MELLVYIETIAVVPLIEVLRMKKSISVNFGLQDISDVLIFHLTYSEDVEVVLCSSALMGPSNFPFWVPH